MTLRCSWLGRGLVGVVLAILATIGVAPVSAQAKGTIEFSSDGVTWGGLTQPLFSGAVTMVPGTKISDRFWVRNPTAQPAFVLVYDNGSRQVSGSSAGLADFVVSVRSRSVESVASLSPTPSCTMVFTGNIGPGKTQQFEAVIELPWSAGNASQSVVFEPRFEVGMGEGAASGDMNACSSQGQSALTSGLTQGQLAAWGKTKQKPPKPASPGPLGTVLGALPQTGAPAIVVPFLGGSILTLAGWWLLTRRRRRAEDDLSEP